MKRTLDRALVIGCTGFLGSWLVDRLVARGVEVTGISRTHRDLLPALKPPSEHLLVDAAAADLSGHLAGVDAVFFTAGVASVPDSVRDPIADLDGNTRAVLQLLQAMRHLDTPPSFVYSSSAAVYGNATMRPMPETHPLRPLSPYGVSKLAAEEYVRLYATSFGVPGASVRPFSIYGPGQDKQVIYDWSIRIANGETPLKMLGSPAVSRDFVYVADAADAMVAVATRGELAGEPYNVASGVETTLGELAERLLYVAGHRASVEFTGAVREGDPVRWQGDTKTLESIGYVPKVQLEDGLRATYEWVCARSAR